MVKLLKMSNFTFFHNDYYAITILKSFDSHISVVVCSFFEFGAVPKWCIGEWVKGKGLAYLAKNEGVIEKINDCARSVHTV